MKVYWNTVSPILESILKQLNRSPVFQDFRLVGGTALSLYLGHRMSVDIDLFTDAVYGSVNFEEIDSYLNAAFPFFATSSFAKIGMGKSYFIGSSEEASIKLDLYHTDPFIRPLVYLDGIRLASVDDIIAMKVEVVTNGGRMKDFWDLHELLDAVPISEMLKLHAQRYPFSHDELEIRKSFADFSIANDDFEPICLQGKHWEFIKLDILKALQT